MYGLPGQTLAHGARRPRDRARFFAVQHLSCYHLTLEPNTRFAALSRRPLPESDLCADMQEAIEARLAAPATSITKPPPSRAGTSNAATT
jgi:coproporphyrinogen III oxidase-like Fe-S oxidoreductase